MKLGYLIFSKEEDESNSDNGYYIGDVNNSAEALKTYLFIKNIPFSGLKKGKENHYWKVKEVLVRNNKLQPTSNRIQYYLNY